MSFLEMIDIIQKKHNVYVLTPHKDGYLPRKLTEMQIPHSNAHYFWWEIALPQNKVLASVKLFVYKLLNAWNYIEAIRMKKLLIRENIDIIHSNSSVINFGALLSKHSRIPHVWHLREYGEEDFALVKVISDKRYWREMNDYAKAYIAISHSIKNKFAQIVGMDKIYQIYNGVSEQFSYKKRFNNQKDKIRFLIAGNYCKEKGQSDVIKAAIELKKQGIENFEVYLAGSGGFAEPKSLTEEFELGDIVTFCGLVNDMQQLRKIVDVEIVASKYEAFGRVTIEAMRMSNPVIGTNTGGTPELIMDGVNGFLFEYGNYKQLADCMKKYIQNNILVSEMGVKAYQTTKGKFTPDENAKRILEVYKGISG